ncbi:MAG: hypothetical protein V4662_13655 [Verrucomicrobiota bacterium]
MSQIKVIGNAKLIFGTVDIAGKVYGECESATIELTGNEEGVPDDMDGFQAFILSNDHYKVTMSTILPKDTPLPARGDRIDVGGINVACSCLGWKQTGEKGKPRKFELTCSHWISIGGVIGVGPTVTTLPVVPAAPPSED